MSAARSESIDSTISFWTLGSTSSRASAAVSSSRVWKTAWRSSGARSSTMSAMSAGCSLARPSCEIFNFTRRAGSVSITSTKFQGILRGGILAQQRMQRVLGRNPAQQPADGAAGSDIDRVNPQHGGIRIGLFVFLGIEFEVDVIDPDHFSSVDVDDLLIQQVALEQKQAFGAISWLPLAALVLARMPPLMAAIAAKGSTRLPDLVLTIRDEMRERSSAGASVTSRTRPAAPDGSYTVAPSSSLRARVVIPLENNQLARESELNSRTSFGPAHGSEQERIANATV